MVTIGIDTHTATLAASAATVICEACGEPLQAQDTTPLTAGS